ncbi:MAG: PaaI family thioesterase [Armatimonadota bacterium]
MLRPLDKTEKIENNIHCNCFACGCQKNGLGLTFIKVSDTAVEAKWYCDEHFQSYPGIIHGGITATILDAAMTNCLLMQEINGLTARMEIEYLKPVELNLEAEVFAEIVSSRPPLYVIESKIIQNGEIRAKAKAKFMKSDIFSDAMNK